MNSGSDTKPPWIPANAGPEFATKFVQGVEKTHSTGELSTKRVLLPEPEVLAEATMQGDRTALSRAITLIESNAPRHRPAARELLQKITTSSNRVGTSLCVGISGVPGAGKSTFIEALGNYLCDAGHRVAVLAVDPSSSITRGSILGDKTRMELLSRREECFIRPSPSSGALGGVARKTRETMMLCEAAGYDILLVETVGVGQSEIAVRSMVDCFLLLLIAGAGDELQGMKKGIFEIADVVTVNKADGSNLPRANATRAEFERVLHFLSPATAGWKVPVMTCSALEKTGISEVWESVTKYYTHLRDTMQLEDRRGIQALEWWRSLVEQELRTRFFNRPEIASLAQELERKVRSGVVAPSLAAEELLDKS